MLTRKQRWRRVRGYRLDWAVGAFGEGDVAGIGRPPHPIDSLSIGDSLLQLMGSAAAAAAEAETSGSVDEEGQDPAADGVHGGGRGNVAMPTRVGNVRFNHQVRVVLVPSRAELERLKTDIWWGENDYFQFRREYIIAMRAAAPASHMESMRNGGDYAIDAQADGIREAPRAAVTTPPPVPSCSPSLPPVAAARGAHISLPPSPPAGAVQAAEIPSNVLAEAAAASCSAPLAQHMPPFIPSRNEGHISGSGLPSSVVCCSVAATVAMVAAGAAGTGSDVGSQAAILKSEAGSKCVVGEISGDAVVPGEERARELKREEDGGPIMRSRPPLAPRIGEPQPLPLDTSKLTPAVAAAIAAVKVTATILDDAPSAVAAAEAVCDEEGFRTQSMSSASDHTDPESLSSDSEADSEGATGKGDHGGAGFGKGRGIYRAPKTEAVCCTLERDERTLPAR